MKRITIALAAAFALLSFGAFAGDEAAPAKDAPAADATKPAKGTKKASKKKDATKDAAKDAAKPDAK